MGLELPVAVVTGLACSNADTEATYQAFQGALQMMDCRLLTGIMRVSVLLGRSCVRTTVTWGLIRVSQHE